MRMSSAKSDRPKEITVWSLPRHSLERDLLVSLYLLKTESGLLKPKQMFWNRRSSISRLLMKPAMSTLIFLAWLSKQKKSSAVLSAVIPTIRWQQQQYHFTSSLLCALWASSSFWQTICLGKQRTVNQEGGWYYVVFSISCRKLLKNLPLQIDHTVLLST